MKDIIILYHGDCPDGFGAAWAAYKKFGNEAEYVGVHHQTSVPKGLKKKEIYFLDFVYPEKIMEKLMRNNKRVTAIDHHISAEKSIKLTKEHVYNIHHSGAYLAWQYFHPTKPVPKLLKYVEDTDIWNFRMPDSKEVFAYINLQNRDFKTWNRLVIDLENDKVRSEYAEKGSIIRQYVKKLVSRVVKESTETVEFEGYETYLVNAAHFFSSQIGEALYRKKPPIAIVWSEAHEMINVSLRSDGSVDVSELAKKHDGGGHKAASGFSFPVGKKAPWKKLRKSDI